MKQHEIDAIDQKRNRQLGGYQSEPGDVFGDHVAPLEGCGTLDGEPGNVAYWEWRRKTQTQPRDDAAQ